MERYKKTLLTRIYVMAGLGIVILVSYLLNTAGSLGVQNVDAFSEFRQGFLFGGIAFVETLFIYFITRYILTLRNPVALKKLYYAENDERTRTIREKSGGQVIFICALTILIAAIIAGYFNEVAFGTLVGCSLFLFITRKALIRYYSRKL